MDPLVMLPFAIVVLTLAACALTGLWAFRAGYRSGYRHARTLPIGRFKGVSINDSGVSGVITLDDDVVLNPR